MSESPSLIGVKLAHFKVLSKLGEGGMGAVYRAQDTRLEREVALKILPGEMADDPERLTRLRREAQVLATLNHPNIGAIYGLEELDGRLILELELVEGEELGERLRRGSLPIDEVVDIATQIALGLEEAHDRGVIHRDLKPSNVMITSDGVVKILDFGLAKIPPGETSGGDLSRLATVSGEDLTREGVIMGTAAYMSPEQARGRKIDHRTDVWAFGCVLFEMLTGRLAFGGETMTDILVSVVSGEPDWSLLPPYTPHGVRRLLRRCLRRDPRDRLRNLGDAAIELAESKESDSAPGTPGGTFEPPSRGLALWALVGPVIGALLGIGLWWVLANEAPTVERPTRRLASVAERVAVYGSYAPALAVSPDGGRLAFAAGDPQQLYLKHMDRVEATPIPGTEGAVAPFFSPDGATVGFWADGELRRVPIGGGSPVSICETNRYIFGATWNSDGWIYFSRPWVHADGESRVSLVRVSPDGGAIEPVADADSIDGREVGLAWPDSLPVGDTMLVTRWSTSGTPPAVEALSLADGTRTVIIDGHQQAVYLQSGHLVAATGDGNVVAFRFRVDTLEVVGEPTVVARGVHRSRYSTTHFAAGSDGAVHWVPDAGSTRPDQLVWVERSGEITPASSHLRDFEQPRVTSAGFAAVSIRDSHDSINVWLLDFTRDTLSPLTIGRGYTRDPLWTPNRLDVVFSVPLGNEALPAGIYSRTAGDSGAPRQLVPGPFRVPTSISADGSTLFFHTIGTNSGWDVWQWDLSQGEGRALLSDVFDQRGARVAPGGGWVAYESEPSDRTEIFVRELGEGSIQGQISPHGGEWPVWSPMGDELFYLGEDHLMSVKVELGDEPRAEPATALFGLDGLARTFDVSADGRRFLMIRRGEAPMGEQINVVLDWVDQPVANEGR